MYLVNHPQIPQDLGVSAHTTDLFKMAGAEAALMDLGLLSASEMEKEAWAGIALGALRGLGGRILTRLGGRAVAGAAGTAARTGTQAAGAAGAASATSGAAGAAGAASAATPGLWARTGGKIVNAGGKVVNAVAAPVGNLGNRAVQSVGNRLGASAETIGKIQGLGKGMAREAVTFGGISGGMNAAMAEDGQRGGAFLRGAAGGALSGLAFRGAGNLATAGLGKALGASRMAKVEGAAAQPWLRGKGLSWGQRAKGVGASALTFGVPLAAGMGTDRFMPSFKGSPSPMQQLAPQAASMVGGSVGAYPRGYAYNQNLPMPQRYGY